MVIITEFHDSVQLYLTFFKQLVFQRPTRCPQCGAEHSFIGHGFYPRKPVDTQAVYHIQIKRWYCSACQHTLSLLPSFLLRFRHYVLKVIQVVIVARVENQNSWRQIIERYTCQGAPSRRTLKRWCHSFGQQAPIWLAAVEQTLAAQDPATPFLDVAGPHAGPLDPPRALLAASLHLLAWAKTQWAQLADHSLKDRLRFLWFWGHGRGLARLV